MKLTNKQIDIWNKAPKCNCGSNQQDDFGDHKLCGICNNKMLYGSHESVHNQNNSIGAWNIDHKIPVSKNGNNKYANLHVVHIYCNQNKANK